MSYTNGFNDGYKKGYDDGYKSQKKSSVGGWGIMEIARSCVSPQTYVDTFTEGYEKGFEQGLFIYNQEQSLKRKVDIIMNNGKEMTMNCERMIEIKGSLSKKPEKCGGKLAPKSWSPSKEGVMVCEKCGGEDYRSC